MFIFINLCPGLPITALGFGLFLFPQGIKVSIKLFYLFDLSKDIDTKDNKLSSEDFLHCTPQLFIGFYFHLILGIFLFSS